MNAQEIISHITALEQERCRCIVAQHYDRLSELLSERLIHTHTRGNQDDKPSYLSFVSGVIESLELRRENLQVIALGTSAAVMHGKQINRARRRGTTDLLLVESVVTQTWSREDDGQWRLVAFQATSLGAPPPQVR